jgi:aryl-alcohol dehydrogenase-like predicted oxidoreductase
MTGRQLGCSGLRITPVGLGTWALGGGGSFGWGPQDDAESIAAIRRAVERGINWIDTAPIYGFGHSESIVAQALKGMRREQRPLVFTKVGFTWDSAQHVVLCLRAGSIRREVEDSLRRLQVDVLDLCQIHWPAFPPGGPDPDLEEGWTTLAALKEEGKIRHIGVSNCDVGQLRRVLAIAPVVSLQPPYSMLMRQVEAEILPFCLEQGIGVIAYAPLHNGLLSGKMTRERIARLPDSDWRGRVSPAFQEPHLTRNLELVELLRGIGQRHGRSVAEVAIAWTLRHQAVTGAIVGARRPEQVDEMAGALEFRLAAEDIEAIQASLPASLEMMELIAGG